MDGWKVVLLVAAVFIVVLLRPLLLTLIPFLIHLPSRVIATIPRPLSYVVFATYLSGTIAIFCHIIMDGWDWGWFCGIAIACVVFLAPGFSKGEKSLADLWREEIAHTRNYFDAWRR